MERGGNEQSPEHLSSEAITEETGYELYEQADPRILDRKERAAVFFNMFTELRMVHGAPNVLTSFFTDEQGLLWLGIFKRPADRDPGAQFLPNTPE
jgi:hypothetical protein